MFNLRSQLSGRLGGLKVQRRLYGVYPIITLSPPLWSLKKSKYAYHNKCRTLCWTLCWSAVVIQSVDPQCSETGVPSYRRNGDRSRWRSTRGVQMLCAWSASRPPRGDVILKNRKQNFDIHVKSEYTEHITDQWNVILVHLHDLYIDCHYKSLSKEESIQPGIFQIWST